ncbi:MAG: hypothetical protein PHW28_06785 [Mesotoga sp.]|nr:hypothetical protein [Mesotoga sp.]
MTPQEINETIAKWLGFEIDYSQEIKWYVFDNGIKITRLAYCPDFYHSFDECIKWIVPELDKRGYQVHIFFYLGAYSIEIYKEKYAYEYNNESLSTAFCEAVDKLIKDGG